MGPARSAKARFTAHATVVVWFGVMVFLGAGMLAKHVVALPSPTSSATARALGNLRTPAQRDRWLAVHVLYADCRCSRRVADHLAHTVRPLDWAEIVLWIGGEAPEELAKRFDVRTLTATDLAQLGIEAAPMMVALDPKDQKLYSGGYTTRQQGPAIEDRRILDDARAARHVDALPIFGCAVSSRLRRDFALLPTP